MNLNSVLIYMNICSTWKKSIGRTKSIQREGREGKIELSPLALNHANRAVALCSVGVICSPFDSWHRPFHFAWLSFYFSPCPHPRTSCTCSIPHSPTLGPPQVLWMGLWHTPPVVTRCGHGPRSKIGLWEMLARGLMGSRNTRMGARHTHAPLHTHVRVQVQTH